MIHLMLIVTENLHKKNSSVYLQWQPRKSRFPHSVTGKRTDRQSDYRVASLLKNESKKGESRSDFYSLGEDKKEFWGRGCKIDCLMF